MLTSYASSVEVAAVAPDGSWLAAGGAGRTVRIWDAAMRIRALMRLDKDVFTSTRLTIGALAVGGSAGFYLFDFVTGTELAVVRRRQTTADNSIQ